MEDAEADSLDDPDKHGNTLGRGVCLRRCHDYVKDTLLKVFKTKPRTETNFNRLSKRNIALVLMKNSTVLRMEMAQRVHFMIPFWSFENVKSPSTLVPVHDAQSQRVSNKSSKYKVGADLSLICGESLAFQPATPAKRIETANVPPTVTAGPINNEAA